MSISIDRDLCENTGCCESLCPEDVFEKENGKTTVVKPTACTECWICVDNCVANAVELG